MKSTKSNENNYSTAICGQQHITYTQRPISSKISEVKPKFEAITLCDKNDKKKYSTITNQQFIKHMKIENRYNYLENMRKF